MQMMSPITDSACVASRRAAATSRPWLPQCVTYVHIPHRALNIYREICILHHIHAVRPFLPLASLAARSGNDCRCGRAQTHVSKRFTFTLPFTNRAKILPEKRGFGLLWHPPEKRAPRCPPRSLTHDNSARIRLLTRHLLDLDPTQLA